MFRHLRPAGLSVSLGLTLSALAGAGPPPAVQAHPDFSGEWALDRGRSRLATPFASISTGVVRIEHREPTFSFSRVFVDKGENSTLTCALIADGREIAGSQDGMPTRQSLSWSAPTLVFLTIYQAPSGEARNTVRYSLLDGGKTLQAEESFHGPRVSYENLWVFSRKE